jgi:tetratricopeptide (TPR) repeat protein
MSNIKNIIRYISDEMEREEHEQFRKQLSSDSVLMEEYRSVLRIWEMTKEKLTLTDLPDIAQREELIAAVIAEHDIATYGTGITSEKESAFQLKLKNIMSGQPSKKSRSPAKRPWRLYGTAALLMAASIAFMVIIIPKTNLKNLAYSYYDPANDPLLELYTFQTRSQDIKAIGFLKEGRYEDARTNFENIISSGEDDEIILLFYAITCYETNEPGKAIELLEELSESSNDTVSYHAKWYLSLMYIMQDQKNRAQLSLEELAETDGWYRKKIKTLLNRSN